MKIKSSKFIYPVFFISVVFGLLLVQLWVADMTPDSISQKYLWRKGLIRIFNNFKYALGDRVFANAVIGKDGWLFYTGDMSIQDYQKTSLISMKSIKGITGILNELKDETEKYGGTFLLVLIPDKSTVYPQYMPDEIPVIGSISNFDRLVAYLDENSQIQVLDMRSTLDVTDETVQTYYQTDSHWNCYGAFYAYQEIASSLAPLYPGFPKYALDDFDIVPSSDTLLDISALMGLNVSEDVMHALPKFNSSISTVSVVHKNLPQSMRIVETLKTDWPDLMIFHDSFYGECLDEYIEPSFRRTISMHYAGADLKNHLSMIAAEKPDVVIVEFVERQMDFFYRKLNKK